MKNPTCPPVHEHIHDLMWKISQCFDDFSKPSVCPQVQVAMSHLEMAAVLGLVQSRDIPGQNGDKDGEDTSWRQKRATGDAEQQMYRRGC